MPPFTVFLSAFVGTSNRVGIVLLSGKPSIVETSDSDRGERGRIMTTEQRALLERFIRLVSTESRYTSEDDDQWLAENWWIVREMRLTDPQADLQRNHWVEVYAASHHPAEPDPERILTPSEIFLFLGAAKVDEP